MKDERNTRTVQQDSLLRKTCDGPVGENLCHLLNVHHCNNTAESGESLISEQNNKLYIMIHLLVCHNHSL